MNQEQAGPRKPGRPNRNDSDARGALLDAGLACVVEHGSSAVSIKQIAEQAGVTPASLHYHFADKSGLLDALIEERLLPVMAGLRHALADADSSPAVQASALVEGVFAMVEQHPWLPRLWLREVLSEGGALREVLVARIAPILPQALAQQFLAAQKRGELSPALDPRLLVVSLIGLTLFPLAAEPIWSQVFAPALANHHRLKQHTLALIQSALSATTVGPPA